MTDADALEQYAAGQDTDAFRHLVQEYQGLVYAVCRRKLGSAADAEDAAQETFLRLARKAGTIRSELGAWLHTCAVNASTDLVRREAGRRQRERAWAAETGAARGEADWEEVLARIIHQGWEFCGCLAG